MANTNKPPNNLAKPSGSNTTNNTRKLPGKTKNIKAEGKASLMDKMGQFQTRNLPILIIIGVFLFFILFTKIFFFSTKPTEKPAKSNLPFE